MERKLTMSPWGFMRFCIIFVLTLWAWSFFRSYLLFLALVLMVCSVTISVLILWSHRDVLYVQAALPDNRVGRSTDFFFTISVHNPSRVAAFPADVTYSWSNLFTGYSERKKQRLWAAPGGGAKVDQYLRSRYAGRVEIRIEDVIIFDMFHIFCLSGCGRTDAHVIVWPTFSEVEEEHIYSVVEGFPEENELKKKGIDYNPDYEVREYIPGDELKSIHWKLSAKKEQLMVRERLATGREKINILVPLGDDCQVNDGLMEAVYALGRLLLHKEYPIQLYWPGRGSTLRGFYAAEQGELENVISEILSDNGLHQAGGAETQMSEEHPGESYILIQTGVYKGAYIRQ